MSKSFSKDAEVFKVDRDLGLLMGFGVVTKINGEDYVDVQGDHIDERGLTEAAMDFMDLDDRPVLEMHEGEPIGKVLFAFPLTSDVARNIGIESSRYGLLIGVRVDDDDVLARFDSGEFTGFSLGGERVLDEVL